MSFARGRVQKLPHTAPRWWKLRRRSSQQAPIFDTGWQGDPLKDTCQLATLSTVIVSARPV
jgi:hypothetical protein